jgi:hypothetical protein
MAGAGYLAFDPILALVALGRMGTAAWGRQKSKGKHACLPSATIPRFNSVGVLPPRWLAAILLNIQKIY